MIRTLILALTLAVALQGVAFGQGIFESVFGQGGYGIPGGQQSQPSSIVDQFNHPIFYSGGNDPNSPYSRQPGMGAEQAPPQAVQAPPGYGQPGAPPQPYQQYYPPSGGVNPDWYRHPPVTMDAQGQVQDPAQPPASYAPPQPPPATAPQQRVVTPQRARSRSTVTAPQAPTQAPPYAGTAQPQLRPGQYSPQQPPPRDGLDPEQLPPGATHITTTTPEGTTVQYYPPAADPAQPTPGVQAPQRQARPRQAAAPGAQQKPATTQTQTQAGQADQGTAGIAMPRPVEIPTGRDPRTGWTGR